MAQTRELRRRIKSVENTRQITKTMEMVATSKLKRAQDRVTAARPYAGALAEIISDLHDPELVEKFPLLRRPQGGIKRAAVIGITSNRGLAGAFNSNLIKMTQSVVKGLEESGAEVELHMIGKKGVGFFKYLGRALGTEYQDITDRPSMEDAKRVINPLVKRFENGELDAVEVVFAKFVSALSTPPVSMRVLPVEVEGVDGSQENKEGSSQAANYILKPSADEIVGAILPLYVRNMMYRALVETSASEQGARRTAMKNATDNAGEMLDGLRRTYNRARQAQITQEISEIVGGAEALSG
ncbi:MAG: F0F1 ATP synthase subunit gamma [Gemmatimonadota bacterium]|nr:F0F1 ATP synthase subunit gamma [Gemmatimonadota bacterium]